MNLFPGCWWWWCEPECWFCSLSAALKRGTSFDSRHTLAHSSSPLSPDQYLCGSFPTILCCTLYFLCVIGIVSISLNHPNQNVLIIALKLHQKVSTARTGTTASPSTVGAWVRGRVIIMRVVLINTQSALDCVLGLRDVNIIAVLKC